MIFLWVAIAILALVAMLQQHQIDKLRWEQRLYEMKQLKFNESQTLVDTEVVGILKTLPCVEVVDEEEDE